MRNFKKISKTVFNLQSGHKYMVEMALFNIQREIAPKVDKTELRFINSARRIIEFYICVKFHQNIANGFKLTRADTST